MRTGLRSLTNASTVGEIPKQVQSCTYPPELGSCCFSTHSAEVIRTRGKRDGDLRAHLHFPPPYGSPTTTVAPYARDYRIGQTADVGAMMFRVGRGRSVQRFRPSQ